MKKLSVIMLTWNGNFLTEKALRSVLPYADVFVYDTGSEDNTWEILQNLQKEFPNLFIFKRDTNNLPDKGKILTELLNELSETCISEYILRMDDDEVFPKETMEEILAVTGEVPVYSIPFLHYEDGHFIDPKSHRKRLFNVARLYKNLPEIKWVNDLGAAHPNPPPNIHGEVLAVNRTRVSSRANQVNLCKMLTNPFLHLGELRVGKRKHPYHYHLPGHCAMPLGQYAKYI